MYVWSVMLVEFVVCMECIKYRVWVARARRVERSVRMDLGQYGRRVLAWRVGGRGFRGRVWRAVLNESVRTRVSRSARRGSAGGGGRADVVSRCWFK